MKISICIPQYNRIEYLIKSLEELQSQNYVDFEVVISDDCSKDDTFERISNYSKTSNYPITYFKFDQNQGYDRNLRKSIELASGEYCFVLGNDDTLSHHNVLNELKDFLFNNNFPDLGFCNYQEFSDLSAITNRAINTTVIGTGPDTGLKHYSCFSFVAGLIFKKSTFDKFNTSKFDKSIYAQIALALHMVCNHAILFSIKEVWVKKDITIRKGEKSNSYRDFINKSFLKITPISGGLNSVIKVLFIVLRENNMLSEKRSFFIFSKILFSTYPFWILDYKKNRALPAAIGLFFGLRPNNIDEYIYLSAFQKLKINLGFYSFSLIAFVIPSVLFFKFKDYIYKWVKRVF